MHSLDGVPRIDDELSLADDSVYVEAAVVRRENDAVDLCNDLVGQLDADPPAPVIADDLRHERIVEEDCRALPLDLLHNEDGRTLAGIVDVRLVGDPRNNTVDPFMAFCWRLSAKAILFIIR